MKRKFKKLLLKISIILIAATVYFSVCASKAVVAIAESSFEAEASTASYAAIGEVVNQKDFSELFTVVSDNDGKITMISTNGLKINSITRKLAKKCLNVYSNLANGGVKVPCGALTGIAFLSGAGKKLNLKVVSVTSVKCEFVSVYESAGINQTKQSLYLKIVPDCKIVAGLKRSSLKSEIEVLCYENYLLGEVPETYLNLSVYTAESK